MLKYQSEYLQNSPKMLGKLSTECIKYEIFNEHQIVATIFASQNFTLVNSEEINFRIERERRPFFKSKHFFSDNTTGESLGYIEFPDWQSASKVQCIIWLTSGNAYSFVERNTNRKMLQPSTWDDYQFELTNSENSYLITGNRIKGKIETNDESSIITIACAFFIIDHKFRSWEEHSG